MACGLEHLSDPYSRSCHWSIMVKRPIVLNMTVLTNMYLFRGKSNPKVHLKTIHI